MRVAISSCRTAACVWLTVFAATAVGCRRKASPSPNAIDQRVEQSVIGSYIATRNLAEAPKAPERACRLILLADHTFRFGPFSVDKPFDLTDGPAGSWIEGNWSLGDDGDGSYAVKLRSPKFVAPYGTDVLLARPGGEPIPLITIQIDARANFMFQRIPDKNSR